MGQFLKDKIIGFFVNILKAFLTSPIYTYIIQSKLFVFVKNAKTRIDNSIFLYTVYVFWPTFTLFLFRPYFLMFLGQWESGKNAHYALLLCSFLVSSVLALFNYLNKKGYLERKKQNAEKWKEYELIVAEKYGIKYNILFSRAGPMIVCSALFGLIKLPHSVLGKLALALFIICWILFFINFFYVWWRIWKTPVPSHLLLEPPRYYYRIFNTRFAGGFIERRYSTRTKFRVEQVKVFYTQNKKLVWATAGAAGGLISSLTLADFAIADQTHQTTVNARVGDMADLGVYTTDPKIRRRIRSLARYKGVDAQDAQDLTYYGSRELDPEKVNSLYEEQCWSPQKKEYKKTVKLLEEKFEAQRAEMQAQQAQMQAQRAEMQAQQAQMQAQTAELKELRRLVSDKEVSMK